MLFDQAVTVGLTGVLGSSGARAAFFHLGLTGSADANRVHDGLVEFFGTGAQSLEASILEELYARVGASFDSGVSMTFAGFVAEARRVHAKRKGGTI